MPPCDSTDAVVSEPLAEYHVTQSLINKTSTLAKKGYEGYTPTRVRTLLDRKIAEVDKAVEPYKEGAHKLVEQLDARLDSSVITPALHAKHDASSIAEKSISNVEKAIDSVRQTMGFVGTSITESCAVDSPDESETVHESVTILQKAHEKVSTLKSILSNKAVKVLENADHGIEVWFPECPEDDSSSLETAAGPVALAKKAARRFRPTLNKRLEDVQLRGQAELDRLVHVDLINYAAEVIDHTAATTYEVAVTKPRKKVAETQEKVAEMKTAISEKVQPVLAKLYTEEVAEAYRCAIEKFSEKKEMVVILVSSSKKYIADKYVIVCNDGTQGLVLELRKEGRLPADQEATIANAMQFARSSSIVVKNEAERRATKMMELAKKSPELAQARLFDLHALVLMYKDQAVTQAPEYWVATKTFADQHAGELLQLMGSSQDMALQKVKDLYAWYLSLSPEVAAQLRTMLEKCKELPVTLPAAAQEKFPETVSTLCNFKTTHVDPVAEQVALAVKAEQRWTELVKKAQEAKEALKVEGRWAMVTTSIKEIDYATLPAKAQEVSKEVAARGIALWRKFFAMVTGKAVAVPASPSQDPLDDKFESYLKEEGIKLNDLDDETAEEEESTEA